MLGLLPRNGCGPDARSLILSASGEGCMRFRVGTAGCGIAFTSVAHVTWGNASHHQFTHIVRVCARAYHVVWSLA